MAIDVCLIFNVAIVCSLKYFRFLFVKLSLLAIGLKIGEAHQTRSSSLYSANTIGAPMHPAPIGVAVRTGKKICETKFEYYWRTVSGQHCLLAEGDIGAPTFTSTNSSVHLAYFHTNRLLFGLYKQETEILRRKDDGNIKK